MNKKTLKKYSSVLVLVVIFISIILYSYLIYKKTKIKTNLINKADNIINENIINSYNKSQSAENSEEIESNKKEDDETNITKTLKEDNNVIGKIIIENIKLQAPIQQGTSKEILKDAVGHFENTNYWYGNVALASHNRGSSGDYFCNLYKIKNGDEIKYSKSCH